MYSLALGRRWDSAKGLFLLVPQTRERVGVITPQNTGQHLAPSPLLSPCP